MRSRSSQLGLLSLVLLVSCANDSREISPSASAGASASAEAGKVGGAAGVLAAGSGTAGDDVAGKPAAHGGAGAAANTTGAAGSAASGSEDAPEPALPCGIATVVAEQCVSCHAATPRLGAPMSLVTWADFQRPAPSDKKRKVHELVRVRIADETNPMPPTSFGTLAPSAIEMLSEWSADGAPQADATEADAGCGSAPPPSTGPGPDPEPAPVAADVTCYDLKVHGQSSPADASPFMVPTGESYSCFYFDAPWPTASQSVAFRSKLDNDQSLHHWFLYAMPSKQAHGTVENCLPIHSDGPKMIAGWAPGGKDMEMPEGVAAETAPPNTTLMLEWHYYNSTSAPIPDQSSVQICTVPEGSRPNVAGITWLGTEDFGLGGMPAHSENSYTGTCNPGRAGLAADAPIHLLYAIPHMHQYGRHLKIEIADEGGTKRSVFDQPFSEKNQAWVETRADVLPGENLLTTCTFENTSDSSIGYGSPFGNGEMCYAFVLHYPAHALDNGTQSLLGASNSCL